MAESYKSAAVFGGANIDIKCFPTEEIVYTSSNPSRVILSSGGVGRNIAHNLALLGIDVDFVSAIGSDLIGDYLLNEIIEVGIRTSALLRTRNSSGVFVSVVSPNCISETAFSENAAIADFTPNAIAEASTLIKQSDLIVADTNLSGDSLLCLAEISAKYFKPMAIDGVSIGKCPRIAGVLNSAIDIFLIGMNQFELTALTGHEIRSDQDLAVAVSQLHDSRVQHVVVTLGGRGCYASINKHGKFVPSYDVAVVDRTGGGDAAVAATLWALGTGRDIFESARIGQMAASLTVSSSQTVSRELSRSKLMDLEKGDFAAPRKKS
jgi:pseudouridine kinase